MTVGQQVAENGGPRLQNRCGAARVALGVFDSHTFPPNCKHLGKDNLQTTATPLPMRQNIKLSVMILAQVDRYVEILTVSHTDSSA